MFFMNELSILKVTVISSMRIQQGLISIGYVKTGEQLGDIFTKALNGVRVDYLCNKLAL
jgi:hypothetical protein